MEKYHIDVGGGTLANVAQKADDIKLSIATRASKSIEGILLAVICLLEALLTFVTLSFSQDFTLMDVVCTISESAVSVMVFYIFIQPGKNGRSGIPVYVSIRQEWQTACSNLRKMDVLNLFRKYCETRTQEERESIKERKLERLENLYITREAYYGTDKARGYCKMEKNELKGLYKKGKLTKAAYKQILDCNEYIEVKPYNPDLILSGTDDGDVEKGLKTGDHYEALGVALRPLVCFIVTIITKILQVSQDESISPFVLVVSILFTLFSICLAAYMGYKFGWNCIKREEKHIEARTAFINQFIESHPQKAPAAE